MSDHTELNKALFGGKRVLGMFPHTQEQALEKAGAFEEEKHPRDEGGKFAPAGGGTPAAPKEPGAPKFGMNPFGQILEAHGYKRLSETKYGHPDGTSAIALDAGVVLAHPTKGDPIVLRSPKEIKQGMRELGHTPTAPKGPEGEGASTHLEEGSRKAGLARTAADAARILSAASHDPIRAAEHHLSAAEEHADASDHHEEAAESFRRAGREGLAQHHESQVKLHREAESAHRKLHEVVFEGEASRKARDATATAMDSDTYETHKKAAKLHDQARENHRGMADERQKENPELASRHRAKADEHDKQGKFHREEAAELGEGKG